MLSNRGKTFKNNTYSIQEPHENLKCVTWNLITEIFNKYNVIFYFILYLFTIYSVYVSSAWKKKRYNFFTTCCICFSETSLMCIKGTFNSHNYYDTNEMFHFKTVKIAWFLNQYSEIFRFNFFFFFFSASTIIAAH